ncbi:MAG: porphobilinogen synthase [Deltaproteobacteria bacterium]|nr:porphobilinogen synthase [Deltaproteobacteria bacterium]
MGENLSLRRLRQSPAIRDLTREVFVDRRRLIQPHFAVEGIREREPVPGLTGVFRETPDSLLRQVETDLESGAEKLLLFGVPGAKATRAFNFDYTAGQIAALRKRFGKDLWIAVDVCLCSATAHGQCGIVSNDGDHVENAATVAELARAALTYAQAGADCVAPSDMMDGRIRSIREILDANRLERTLLMSYSAKFNSKFYGPFRAAADSAPKGDLQLKDRATYQIDPARPTDALASSRRDAEEGADILMVKPGMPYLDILAKLSKEIEKPWAVYEVSGEFAAIELMAAQGLVQGPAAHVESWTAFFRAGASMVITYGARYAKEWLKECL